MNRYGLKDAEWEKIKDILPGIVGCIGVTAKDNRLFIEAVLYQYRTGIPWRDLPERFGDFRFTHVLAVGAKKGFGKGSLKYWPRKLTMNM